MHALKDSGSNQAMLEDQKEYGAKQGLISTLVDSGYIMALWAITS